MRPLAALLAAGALLAGAAAAQAAPALPLGHAGRWLTDADGRVVVSHGFNMVDKRAPYAPDAIGFGDDDAAFLAREGYNSVRVGVIYKAVEPRPGVYDDAYLDRIAATVRTLGAHGIASVLDFHQDLFNERFAGEGFPDWAVQDDGLPNQPNLGFPGNYLGMPALQRAFDHFWNNDPAVDGIGLQDHFAAAWRHVAERFRGMPDVLGYELLNEPWPGTVWQPCLVPTGCADFDAKLGAFSARVLRAIREADARTLVLYEPNVLFNNGVATQLADLGDPNLVFSFHDYCLTAGSAKNTCDTFDDLVFANAERRSAGTGDALLLTEFGATDDTSVLRAMADRADRTMVGWQEWHYCGCDDPTTSGPGAKQAVVLDPARPPAGDNLRAATLRELTRPYPQLTAGTPVSFGFTPETATFRFDYTTARADRSGRFGPGAVTEIATPARQYPDGYAARVEGARILSAPGAATLQVTACAGADRVRVTVTPRGATTQTCTAPAARRTPRLHVTVSPRIVRAGRTVTLRVLVRTFTGRRGAAVRGARVRAGGVTATTGAQGVARLRVRFAHPGRRAVTARAAGARAGRATVTVRARRR